MVNSYFLNKIEEKFSFIFTDDQKLALTKIVDFIFSQKNNQIFILKGYAGTGKSSLIGSLVKTMTQYNQRSILLAPTGRAAKVFSSYADKMAYTIHRIIYRMDSFGDENNRFSLAPNRHKQTLFVVDEASMISNSSADYSIFGSGRLLDDLLEFVYSGEGNKLILIGDTAQLPPVKQERSPALQAETFKSHLYDVEEVTLTDIVRQAESSGILSNATNLRINLRYGNTTVYPKLELDSFKDVKRISGIDFVEEISNAYSRYGMEDTIVISRSNKRVNAYNNGIRNRVLYREEELSSGDLLMITRNNYFWITNFEKIDFLANGEIVQVLRIRKQEELYGFRFCTVLLKHLDYDVEFEAIINLDSLHTEAPSLTREQYDKLFTAVMEDYIDITQKRMRYKKIKENPYFNALSVKYGYAVTCHKAQGGEWKNVFLDIGYIDESYLGDNFYRWLYTSMTRSSEMLYLVNLPDDFVALSK